jgi:hypothetical protein
VFGGESIIRLLDALSASEHFDLGQGFLPTN